MRGVGRYSFVFFQAEDGIRDLVRSRGLGDVYKRQREALVVLLVSGTSKTSSRRRLFELFEISTAGRRLSLIHI